MAIDDASVVFLEQTRRLGITAIPPATGESFKFTAFIVDKQHRAATPILDFDVRMTPSERDAVLAAPGRFFAVLISRPRTFLKLDLIADLDGVIEWRDTVLAPLAVDQRVPTLLLLALDEEATTLVLEHGGLAGAGPAGSA